GKIFRDKEIFSKIHPINSVRSERHELGIIHLLKTFVTYSEHPSYSSFPPDLRFQF
ncbi:unnamed protein product, partial [Musa acuminata var. zebrina]